MNTRRLRLLQEVRSDIPVGARLTAKARVYEPNQIRLNPHGAVSVLTPQGWLGIKPNEMEWIEEDRLEDGK